jgi:hypothetical protein
MAGGEESFDDFWQHYLRHHAQEGTRMLHVLGMVIGAVALIVGLVTVNPMISLAGAGLGYLLAWTGHFLVEKKRPTMVSHPHLVVSMRPSHVPAVDHGPTRA